MSACHSVRPVTSKGTCFVLFGMTGTLDILQSSFASETSTINSMIIIGTLVRQVRALDRQVRACATERERVEIVNCGLDRRPIMFPEIFIS